MAAFLWPDLVFNVQASDACALVFTDGATNVDGIAVSLVGIRNQGYIPSNCCQGGSAAHHLAYGEQSYIWLTRYTGGSTEAGHIHSGKTSLHNEPRAQGIIRAGDDQRFRPGQQLAQACRGAHHQVLPAKKRALQNILLTSMYNTPGLLTGLIRLKGGANKFLLRCSNL